MDPHTTREGWLVAAVDALRPVFAEHGHTIPEVRVSVGWPGGRGKKTGVIGQCWKTTAAADGVAQVFVSPALVEPLEVLSTLVHELAHAIDDCSSGHRGAFVRIAKSVGLLAPWTSTPVGEELAPALAAVAEELGDFPHAKLGTPADRPKIQSTRMLKVECLETGYIARTSAKWLEQYGAPLCPCHSEPMARG